MFARKWGLAVVGLLAWVLAGCTGTQSGAPLVTTTTLPPDSSCQKSVVDQTYGMVTINFCPGVEPDSQPATVAAPWTAIRNAFKINPGSKPLRFLNDWYMHEPNCRDDGVDCYPLKGQTVRAVCTATPDPFVAVLVGTKTVRSEFADFIVAYTNKGNKPIGWVRANDLYVPPGTPDCIGMLHGTSAQSQLPQDAAKAKLDPNN